ncbi:UNVERIFIED_CONTAM: hypothetical protein DES50_101234 [Williamsia faeni]
MKGGEVVRFPEIAGSNNETDGAVGSREFRAAQDSDTARVGMEFECSKSGIRAWFDVSSRRVTEVVEGSGFTADNPPDSCDGDRDPRACCTPPRFWSSKSRRRPWIHQPDRSIHDPNLLRHESGFRSSLSRPDNGPLASHGSSHQPHSPHPNWTFDQESSRADQIQTERTLSNREKFDTQWYYKPQRATIRRGVKVPTLFDGCNYIYIKSVQAFEIGEIGTSAYLCAGQESPIDHRIRPRPQHRPDRHRFA